MGRRTDRQTNGLVDGLKEGCLSRLQVGADSYPVTPCLSRANQKGFSECAVHQGKDGRKTFSLFPKRLQVELVIGLTKRRVVL